MKKIVRLTESDLTRIVKKVIKEERLNELGGMEDSHPRFGKMNLSKYSPDELDDILNDRLGDDDEYYGTFDDIDRVDRRNRRKFDDYEDYEDEEFDFDSYRSSKYGRDEENRWSFNDPNPEVARRYWDAYQKRSGGKPFKVRRRRR